MASRYANGVASGPAATTVSSTGHLTPTALGRWSIADNQLPAAGAIKYIHVYDFDNTLFKTPLPNPKLWHQSTLGKLASPDIFVGGGWWHNSRILAATGEGVEQEEARAWKGWWNEQVVELVQLSMQSKKDTLSVLLTGRSERGFTGLLKRMLKSKGLEFDMIGLKPEVGPNNERFKSTLLFKQAFLTAVMETYREAVEIRIYEDRLHHVTAFRDFLQEYNQRQSGNRGPPTRPPITANVIPVTDMSTTLDPVVEVAEIQTIMNEHNAAISQRKGASRLELKKSVFFTAYMITPEDAARLVELVSPQLPEADLKFHSNAVVITSRPCPPQILDKVGGKGAKMQWGVTGIGVLNNNLWAVSVAPIPSNSKYHTDNPTPTVVVATRGNARPADVTRIHSWQPVPPDKVFAFDTEVGEKLLFRIESESGPDNDNNSTPNANRNKRKFGSDNDYSNRSNDGNNRGHHNSGNYHGRGGNQRGGYRGDRSQNRGYRGGPGRGRGGGGGGRGGRGGYRSLDEVGTRDGPGNNYGGNHVSYDDSFPPLHVGNGYGGPPGVPYQPMQPPPPFNQQQQSFQPQNGQYAAQGGSHSGSGDLQKFY